MKSYKITTPYLSLSVILRALMAPVLAGLLTSCQSPSSESPYPEATTPPKPDVLKEGDVIQVAFPGATNLNTTQKIPLNGEINIPFAGQFKPVGSSPQELEQEILKRYGDQLQLKEVQVSVISSSATVYVSGAVLRPGRFPIERPMTALEAIMEAGGFDPQRSKPGSVIVIRYEDGKEVNFHLNLKRALDGKESQPFYVKPFDIIHVPTRTFNL
jgi:polysaccharide export outer membrane protein